jgi:flagellar hook assembly protein FlgD
MDAPAETANKLLINTLIYIYMQKRRFSGLSRLIIALVAVMTVAPAAMAYQVGMAPSVTSHYATPNPYDPTSATNFGDVRIDFYINTETFVDTYILGTDATTVIVNGGSTPEPSAGNYNFTWNGKVGNTYVAPGTYYYRIRVHNMYDVNGSSVTGAIQVINTDITPCTTPVISNYYASPATFNPQDESTNIYYTLNTAAQVTVEMLNGSSVIATLGPAGKSAGSNVTSWSGLGVVSNTYTYRITAHTTSCGDAVRTGTVEVSNSSQSGTAPTISNNSVSPNPFDPDKGDTIITFKIDESADITLDILDHGSVIRNIVDNSNRNAGTLHYHWNGEDSNGNRVDNATYTYRIRATNNGTDTVSGSVRVTDSTSTSNSDFTDDYGDLISNVTVENALFNPDDAERAKLIFDVEQDNVDVQVNIIDTNDNSVRELINNQQYDQTTGKSLYWNGRDDSNTIVDDDIYLFKLEADKGSDHEVAYRYVEVNTDGNVIGFPDNSNGGNCAGFTDVSTDNPYCKAIELMKIKGIFSGYPDGTFRIYSPINRAETVKVVILAIARFTLMSDNGTNLGFRDVVRNAWYMPYLRTAQSHGIIRGYPDGSFRPNFAPNKVELLKIFLEGTGIHIPICNVAPYNDTPADSWYNNYLCFAKDQGLVSGDSGNNYNPAQPMNRGDVAMLFYNFYVRGINQQTPYYTGNNNYGYDAYGYPIYDNSSTYDYSSYYAY